MVLLQIQKNVGPKMKIPSHIEPFSSFPLGKKDKKAISKSLHGIELDGDAAYKIYKCKDKLTVIALDGVPLLFSLHNSAYIPTLALLYKVEASAKIAYVDKGALKPIVGGADVMCPGVYKYREHITKSWEKNDVVLVKVIDHGNVAVGIAEIGSADITSTTMGVCITVFHRINDALYTLRLY
jgi:PUA domain protein